jgi:ketosteroid isomerase-like protein
MPKIRLTGGADVRNTTKLVPFAVGLALMFALPLCAMQVELADTEPPNATNKPVVEELQKLMQALAKRDINEVGDCLSEEVTIFDPSNHGVVYGKKAVLEHISKNVIGTTGDTGVKKLVIYHPYVSVKDDTAMISFHATKEPMNSHSPVLESWCSEVFERVGDRWKILHFQSNWKPQKTVSKSEEHK